MHPGTIRLTQAGFYLLYMWVRWEQRNEELDAFFSEKKGGSKAIGSSEKLLAESERAIKEELKKRGLTENKSRKRR